MLKGLQLMQAFGRYSIVFSLGCPIYVFSTRSARDNPYKLSIAILVILVILTTYKLWEIKKIGNEKADPFWKYADRLTVLAIIIIALYDSDFTARSFIIAGIVYYLVGYSAGWDDHNSFLNHIAFRFFAALGLILYVVDRKKYQEAFVALIAVVSFFGAFLTIKDMKKQKKSVKMKKSTIVL